jgi:hypothetical protein
LFLKRLQHFLTASNSKGHGMHSPFVFDFIINVLNDDSLFSVFNEIKNNNNELIKSSSKLDQSFFITKKKYRQLFFKIINYYQFKNIVTIERNGNAASLHIAVSNPTLKITTISSDKMFQEINQLTKIDFIFINTIILQPNLFHQIIQSSHNNSFIIINNIYADKEAAIFWDNAKNHSSTKASIDLFDVGIILFNNDFKVKQHFKVKF